MCEIPTFFEAYKSEKNQAYINPNWKHRMTGLGFYLGSHIFCWLKRLKTMGKRMDGYQTQKQLQGNFDHRKEELIGNSRKPQGFGSFKNSHSACVLKTKEVATEVLQRNSRSVCTLKTKKVTTKVFQLKFFSAYDGKLMKLVIYKLGLIWVSQLEFYESYPRFYESCTFQLEKSFYLPKEGFVSIEDVVVDVKFEKSLFRTKVESKLSKTIFDEKTFQSFIPDPSLKGSQAYSSSALIHSHITQGMHIP